MLDSKHVSLREVRIAKMQADLVEVMIILEDYKKGKVGAAGADKQIAKILFKLGHARTQQVPPMAVGFHKLNRGRGPREQVECSPHHGEHRSSVFRLE